MISAIININDIVLLNLTEEGKKVIEAYYEQYNQKIEIDTNIPYRTTLWNCAAIFGPHLHMGMQEPFFKDNNITINMENTNFDIVL